jgi:DNA-binding beta-propeller fold protein YncE
MRSISRYSILIAFGFMLQLLPAFAQKPATDAGNCNQPMPDPVTHIKVTGDAWQPLSTRDGCWMFVALGGGPKATPPNGLAVLHRNGAAFEQVRVVPNERPISIALTHDEKTLVVSVYADTGGRIELLDVGRLTSGQGNALMSSVRDQHFGSLQSGLIITSDDKYLLVSQKITSWISIIDLDKARSGQAASSIVGGIPLTGKPLGMELSPDRRYLYLSGRFDVSGTSSHCKVANTGPVGIQIFDLERALVHPDSSMIAAVPAGCTTDTEPTDGNAGIAFSPDGNTVYALAGINGGENTLFTFDARPLQSGSAPTPVSKLPMSSTLRRLALVDEGKKLLVTTWNQFGNDSEGQVLTVINTAKLARGEDSIDGTIPIGTGGGSMSVTPDGQSILIAARTSETITRVEWVRVPLIAQQAKNVEGDCNQPMPDAITHFPMEGITLSGVTTPDGCWLFVARTIGSGNERGIEALRREGGKLKSVRLYRFPGESFGNIMAITGDGSMLIAGTLGSPSHAVFLDVTKLTSGQADPLLGTIRDNRFSNSNFVAVTPDNKYAFVSHINTEWLTVIDIPKARATNFSAAAIVGGMSSGTVNLPVISPDGRYLYFPNQVGSSDPAVCKQAGSSALGPSGAILVLDLQRIGPDLSKSIIATIPAGCSTQRVAVSPDGNTLYATAMLDNTLMAFDVSPLKSGGTPIMIGKVPTGPTPVGITLIRNGAEIVIANTNAVQPNYDSFDPGNQSLTVIDTTRISEGARAVVGTIPTKSGPRNPTITADGRTLFVNSASGSLEIIDLERVKPDPIAK